MMVRSLRYSPRVCSVSRAGPLEAVLAGSVRLGMTSSGRREPFRVPSPEGFVCAGAKRAGRAATPAAPAAEDAAEVFSAAASTALDEPGWEQPHPRVAP